MLRIAALLITVSIVTVWSSGDAQVDFPCKVVDGDHVYDLSELAARDYWEYVETLHTGLYEKRKLYIGICHPVRNVSVACEGDNVGVCETQLPDGPGSEVALGGRGQPSTQGPVVTEEGWLSYVFENGAKCNKSIRQETYKTYINFRCARNIGSQSSGPILMSSPGCELNFAWMTKAACPQRIESTNASACIVKFSNSDDSLNLHTLHSATYYNVTSSSAKYEINVCGPVTNGHCGDDTATICDVTDPSAPVVLGTTQDMVLEWQDATLDLAYKHGAVDVKIKFLCERTATSPQIYFVEKNDTSILFSVRTAAVCTPEEPVCVVEDEVGNVYDLRSLHKKEGNWEVIDGRSEHRDQLYHINVCGEVNDGRNYLCPSGPIGACMATFDARTSFNLGFLTSHPHVNKDGSITILYTGGDPCKNGHHSRSTRINLICDPINHDPIFVEETDTCEYIFNWLTPAACPRHVVEGGNCSVKDPLYGNVYDLNPLRNKQTDYKTSDGEHDYLINLCGPLTSPCNGDGRSGVCQVKDDQQYSGGLATTNVTFNDGTLIMNYKDGSGKCNGDHVRNTQILFVCDQNASGRDGPHFLHEDETCTYHFMWLTQHACPPFSVVDCSLVTKDGLMYDLNELSSPNMNEEYHTPDNKKKFVLNVCRTVVHSKESRCPYRSGACVIDLEHHNQSLNIGEVRSGLYIEDGNLKIKYSEGEPCSKDGQASETIIEFKCDKKSLYPYPQLIAQENCKYIFEWKTPLACPTEMHSSTVAPPSTGDCTAKNTYTGYVFDLNPLNRASGYEISDDGDLHLILNVCGEVSTKKCPEPGSGACTYMHDNHTVVASAGKANNDLQYHPGFLYLHYTGGKTCDNGTERSTFISFICGAEDTHEGPVLIHEDLDKCIYYINWYTDAACERRINCYVDTWEQRLDLTPLIRTTDNYEVSNQNNPKEKFYLNVCRPLNPVIGLNCRPGSAACLSSSGSDSLSLGQPIITPQYAYDDGIQMMYSHGSKCPSNPEIGITSRITFKCDKSAGKGTPVYLNVTHDCQYQFEWLTALACEDSQEMPATGPACQIQYEAAKTNVDLKPLSKPGGYTVKFDSKVFQINVCGSAACDNKSAVCTSNGESYGLTDMSDLQWDYDKLLLTYYGGGNCSTALSGHRTTSVYFECDMNAGYGKPIIDPIMRDIECKAVFNWKTNVTCLEAIYKNEDSSSSGSEISPKPDAVKPTASSATSDTPAPDHKKDDEPHSSLSATISSVFVITGVIFVTVLFLFKSQRGQRIVSSARRIFGLKGYSNLSQPHMEGSTLLGPTSARVYRVDESDDDLLRV